MQRLQMIALATLGAMAVAAPAQSSGGPYRIDSAVIAGGGATLSGGAFQLSGTVGQPATSMLGASSYRLYDGFWVPTSPLNDLIFANGFDP
jgi:hypothetical protein